METNDNPHLIYHYASLKTFGEIISNKTLRLSDIAKSNDSAEITWFKHYIPDAFRMAYIENKTKAITPELAKAFDAAFHILFGHAITMKNPFFKEENETRVYCMLPNRSILNESYRAMPAWKKVLRYDIKDNCISSHMDIPHKCSDGTCR